MYKIFINHEAVGNAEVSREGLYYRFRCSCTLPDNGIYRVFVNDGTITKDLGICVPVGDRFTLSSRVPIKYLPGNDFTFSLIPKSSEIPVSTDKPFSHLDKLENSKFQNTDGQAAILIDSVPDQQDNDQSQESLHIWEQP